MQRRTFLTLGGGLIASTAVTGWVVARRRRGSARKQSLEVPSVARREQISEGTTAPPATYSPPVRVNLTPQPANSIRLGIDGPYELRVAGTSRVLGRGERLAETEVMAKGGGFRVGKETLRAESLEVHPRTAPAVWVDDHQYRGDVRLYQKPDNRLIAVNVVPLEEYIASVVDSEMPAAFPAEARKTQAILARTYAVFRLGEGAGHPEFELYNTSKSQKYLGVQYRTADGRRLAGESESSRKATRDTAGVVCMNDGHVFSAYYCACCGGRTIDGTRVFTDAAPVIRGVTCGFCRESELYRWTTRLSKKEAGDVLRKFFAERGETFGALKSLKRNAGPDEGPSHLFTASDGKSPRMISAVDLRRTMPVSILFSPFFDVREERGEFVFTGRGHGHGVGVCQWGARGLALEQKDCYDILRHYYPGVTFVTLKGKIEN